MKQITVIALLILGGGMLAFRTLPARTQAAFTVPPGFAVEEVLSPELAQSVVAITFDSQGRLVMGKEFGNVVTLVPGSNGDYEQRIFTEEVHTSQGIFFDGPDLIVDGAGPQGVGLYRVVDEDDDARGDRVELIELATGTIGDHGPHAPFFGPDGYLYWVHGNFSNIYPNPAPLSPVRGYREAALLERADPRGFGSQYEGGPGGIFLRKAIASKGAGTAPAAGAAGTDDWELVSNGFRNQYDGAFNLMGELLTFDSDMEWDRDLPWYRPVRTVHVVPGGDYGYREGTGKHPPYYFDDLPPIEELGRGSPTGVAVYQSYGYPAAYWDAPLLADWSRGRIVVSRLTKDGATYSVESENFVYGEPLNVTDVDVGPDGNVYFALGGRSTAGGIYRVVYTAQDAMAAPSASTPIEQALTMAQPRSAYSRERARTIKEEMGESAWRQALAAEVENPEASPERRVRALELLQVFGPGLDEALLLPLLNDAAWEVRAASTYYLGLKTSASARAALVARFGDADPFVQRRAAEALTRTGITPAVTPPFDPVGDVVPLLASADRFVRYAARKLLIQTNSNLWKESVFELTAYPQVAEGLLAYIETIESPDMWNVSRLARRELELIGANPGERELLDLVRVIQRTILERNGVENFSAGSSRPGNIQERRATGIEGGARAGRGGGGGGRGGGPEPVFAQLGEQLLARFPAADSMLNRELARTLAALETPGAAAKIAAELGNPRNGRDQQIHYADVLSYIESGWDDATIDQMTAWLAKVWEEGWRGGAGFSGAINQIRDGLLAHVPPERYAEVAQRIEAAQPQLAAGQPQFGGRGQTQISLEEIEESLIYNPNVLEGDAAGGVAAYEQAGCIACHTFGPIGAEFGPDLTTVHQRFSRTDLVRAVTRPSETVSDLWQVEQITRTNGPTVSGTIYQEDGSTLTVQVTGTAQLVTIPKSEIQSRTRSEQSPMPEGLLNMLSGQEQRNLFLLLQAGPSAIPDSALARLGANR